MSKSKSKPITTGRLAEALQKYNKAITDGNVRAWAEEGLIHSHRAPLTPKARYKFEPEDVEMFLIEQLKMSEDKVWEVMKLLGVNFKQLLLVAL